MIINLQGIGIWILIAVLKHMTGAQPGLSGRYSDNAPFYDCTLGKAEEDKRVHRGNCQSKNAQRHKN